MQSKDLDSCQRHILIRKEKKTKKNMWLSKATLQLIRQRNEAWKRFKRYESLKNYECYRKIRNEVVDKIRLDKLQYQDKLVNSFKGTPKKFYACIRRTAKVKDRITRLVITGQKLTSMDEETAEVLLKEFESVFVNEGVWNGPVLNQPSQVSNAVDISPDMVLRKLQVLYMYIDKAVGPDGLHPMVLSKAAVHLAVPLSMIFNTSLQESKVPDYWKVADVVPIFKKGSAKFGS